MKTASTTYERVASQSRRDELILGHMYLVRHVLGKLTAHLPPGMDLENLEAAGMLGLVEAANHFDVAHGIQFKTYAFTRIRGAILDELRRNCPLPQHMLQRLVLVRKAYKELQNQVTVDNLAAATGLTRDEVADCLAAMRMTRMISWDQTGEFLASRPDQTQDRPSDRLEQEEQCRVLAQTIAALPERERLVVTLYYHEDLRLKEIGQVLNLSESRVSRLLSSALLLLNEALCAKGELTAGAVCRSGSETIAES